MKKFLLILIIFINIISFPKSDTFKSDGNLNIEKLLEKEWSYGNGSNEGLPTLKLKINIENDGKYSGTFKTETGMEWKQEFKLSKKVMLQDEIGYAYDVELKKLVVINPDDLGIIFIAHD